MEKNFFFFGAFVFFLKRTATRPSNFFPAACPPPHVSAAHHRYPIVFRLSLIELESF
ncbi:hypothetical protein IC582_004610 [Cucumis melo]